MERYDEIIGILNAAAPMGHPLERIFRTKADSSVYVYAGQVEGESRYVSARFLAEEFGLTQAELEEEVSHCVRTVASLKWAAALND